MQLHHVQVAPTVVPRYVSPLTIDDALQLLADHGHRARAIAGGTDLVVELDRGAHAGLDLLVDLSRIDGLDTITVADGHVHLGALVTHSQVVESEVCRNLVLPLAQASLEVGSPQLRNRATVAGNVITASPANDTISALLALGADVHIASTSARRSVPIADFITGFRTTVLAPDELVTGISVRALTGNQRGVFVKAGLRRAQAISVVHLTAVVTFDDQHDDQHDDRLVTDAVLTLGSVAATVVPVAGFGALLRGRRLDDAAIADAVAAAVATATPIDDLRATAEYRTSLVATMVERALRALASGQQASQWPDGSPLLRPPTTGSAGTGTSGTGTSPSGIDVDAAATITATVNGKVVTAAGAAGVTLLDWLRDQAGTTGVKEGCAEGECGACTVHLDGAAVMSCLVPAGRAAGSRVVTVEGLADDDRLAPIQAAFVDCGAVQCGFCTPGLLMSCAKLLDEHPTPTLRQVQLGLAGNLCRCTGYTKILDAIVEASERMAEGEA